MPIHSNRELANALRSKIAAKRIIRNTPAVTIVAECRRAETGVGPSIASGNHECNPICADLPTAARIIKIDKTSQLDK